MLLGALHLVAFGVETSAVGPMYTVVAVAVSVLILAFGLSGFYRLRFVHPALEMKRMAWVIGIIGGTATLTSFLITRSPEITLLVAIGGFFATILLPTCRVFARVLFARLPWWGLPTAVVSFGDDGKDIITTLDRWPEIGLRPVAWLGGRHGQGEESLIRGTPRDAPSLAQAFDIPCAIVSMPDRSHTHRAKLLARYSKFFDQVFSLQGVDSPALWTTGHREGGLRGYSVANAASSSAVRALKRTIDVLGAGFILLILSPLFATIAFLIRIDSEGPIFFRQERMGENGQTFTLLKFRSMYADADERLAQVLRNDPQRRREYEEYHKLRDDPRVTKIGEILRQYSLDELPQLLNVLRGDMSLVGPRAYMPAELPKMKGLEQVILRTPPGVTGLWQVSGRNQLRFKERVDLDVHYVQNWSLWLDFYLLVRTIPTVLMREGAA